VGNPQGYPSPWGQGNALSIRGGTVHSLWSGRHLALPSEGTGAGGTLNRDRDRATTIALVVRLAARSGPVFGRDQHSLSVISIALPPPAWLR